MTPWGSVTSPSAQHDQATSRRRASQGPWALGGPGIDAESECMATFTIAPPTNDLSEPARAAQNYYATAPDAVTPTSRRSLGETLWIGVPLTMVAVCLLTVIMFLAGGIPLGEAFGYGAYLAVWIGGGFGVILTGAYYNHIHDGLEG